MIPTAITTSGDKSTAVMYIGIAKTQMRKLRDSMTKHRRTPLKEDYSTVKIDNVVIECWSSFKKEQIHITVLPQPHKPGEKRLIKQKEVECLCFPHLSFGVITKVTPSPPIPEDFEYPEDYQAAVEAYNVFIELFLIDGRFQYDVNICSIDTYILFEGAYDANFGKYYVGQYVLVGIGDEMDEWEIPLDCDRRCLVNDPKFDELIITPLHVNEKMKKWFQQPERVKRYGI